MRALLIDIAISLELSYFVTSVKALNAINRTDINKVAENILIPIFAEAYDFSNLHSLNVLGCGNFPSIDLADETARLAIQVTSTPALDKIKHTLEQFLLDRKELVPPLKERYDRVVVYILTERQVSYSQPSINALLDGRFVFDASKDVWDYKTLNAYLEGLSLCKKEAILGIMQGQLGFTRSLLHSGVARIASDNSVVVDILRRCVNALDELWTLQRRVIPTKGHPDMEWEEALEDIALTLDSHSQTLRSILDRFGAVLPQTVINLLESAEAAAQDGALEASFGDFDNVPQQACREADRMYSALTEASATLRANLASRGIPLD